MIAVDWGTSGFRAYRLRTSGEVVEQCQGAQGILNVAAGQFAQTLQSHIGPWLAQGESLVLMCGMVGARQGWVEAPYCECPADFVAIASKLTEVRWEQQRAYITPGVSGDDSNGVREVMRGEEMQILGCLDQLPGGTGLICLPGTHSKWVQVREGRILRFATHMTGEVFALLKQHSILGRMMKTGETDLEIFREGLQRARQSGGLLHHLFGVRTRGLFGSLADENASAYLSGLLIGHELQAALAETPAERLYLLGAPELTRLYSVACENFTCLPVTLPAHAAARGLFALARHMAQT